MPCVPSAVLGNLIIHVVMLRTSRPFSGAAGAAKLGHKVAGGPFFDTVRVNVGDAAKLVQQAESQGINLRQLDSSCVTVAFDETTRQVFVPALAAASVKPSLAIA